MSCSHPHCVADLGINPDTGKRFIKFVDVWKFPNFISAEKHYGQGKVFFIPCGKCEACQLDWRKEWSIRCMLESSLFDSNCFVTLTYDDDHLEDISKQRLQKWIHKLHDAGLDFRYFACGEYGIKSHRPHYHLIMFGYKPNDLKVYGKSQSGEYIYTSKSLQDTWPFGNVMIGDVSVQSCSYVAGYVGKKVGNYTGFILHSNRPGIGACWCEDHLSTLYCNDNIVLSHGNVVSIPRYFDTLAEKNGIDLSRVRDKRLTSLAVSERSKMIEHQVFNKEILFDEIRTRALEKYKKLKRKGV